MRTNVSGCFVCITALGLAGCGGEQGALSSGELGGAISLGGRPQAGHTQTDPTPVSSGTRATGGASSKMSESTTGGVIELTSGAGRGAMGGVANPVGSTPTSGGTVASQPSQVGGRSVLSGGAAASGGTVSTNRTAALGGTTHVSEGGSSSGAATQNGGAVTLGGNSNAGGSSSTSGGTTTAGATTSGGAGPVWPKKFCGNITTGNGSVDYSGMKFSRYWDQITPENAGKWGSVQSSTTSAFNWTVLDAIYAYALANGIPFKEHTFVWGAGNPSRVATSGDIENWIQSFCERYPKVALIDVVNEPPPHTTPNFAANLTTGETGSWGWITKSFKLARKHCGSAVLILNDYYNIEYVDQQDHFAAIVKDMQAAGAPIDAVGAQAHGVSKFTASELQAKLDRLSLVTGLPVYISEYDVGANDTVQLEAFRTQFPVFWNTENVRGVTVWGWIDGRTWISSSGLVNGTTPRPAMTWLMDYLGRPTPPL